MARSLNKQSQRVMMACHPLRSPSAMMARCTRWKPSYQQRTNPQANLSHEELKVDFTATAIEPPVITLTLHREGVTQTTLQWIAEVSGRIPEAYVYYYKKSADREWIEFGNLRRGARKFSFVHSELQPGTSYDFQLFALKNGRRFGPGSNVLTARTLSGTGTGPPVQPPVAPPVEQPEEPQPPEETPEGTTGSTARRNAGKSTPPGRANLLSPP